MIGYVLGTLVIGDANFNVSESEAREVLTDVQLAVESNKPTKYVKEIYEFGVRLLTVAYAGNEYTVAATPAMQEVLRKSLLGVREDVADD